VLVGCGYIMIDFKPEFQLEVQDGGLVTLAVQLPWSRFQVWLPGPGAGGLESLAVGHGAGPCYGPLPGPELCDHHDPGPEIFPCGGPRVGVGPGWGVKFWVQVTLPRLSDSEARRSF
jgi:hypothetical protein